MKRRWKSGQASRAATVAALVIIALLWVRLFFVHPQAEGLTQPAAPGQARLAQRKLDELSGAVSRLSEAAQRGEARSATVHFSAAEINAMLAAEPEVQGALAEARISAPEVRLEPGRVITTARMERATVTVPVTAEGELAARQGMLLYASDTVRVGGVPAGAAVRAAVDARIQAAFGWIEQPLHARVDRVTVDRNRITLRLSSLPE